jgi:phosphatidylinositol alpha-1,6-mannosyltransferase
METYSKELFDAFRAEGADVELLKPGHHIDGRPSLKQLLGFFAAAVACLWRGRSRYDAVLLGDFALAPLAMVAKLFSRGRATTLVSLHGNDLYFMRGRSLAARLYAVIGKATVLSHTVDGAIANSVAIKAEAETRGITTVAVVPLATRVPPVVPPVARERFVLFAGRLIRYKGLAWFVKEVWPAVDPSLELWVAGPVWDESELAALECVPRVRYLGVLPFESLLQLRARAVACVMPNIPPSAMEQDEGFGLSALEAPAVGTPILAARSGGLPDAVADGVTGYLLPPLAPQAWIEVINDIGRWPDERRSEFAAAARRYVERHYNWALVARRTLDAIGGAHRKRVSGSSAPA